ncbi:hypothetical protein HDE_11004 [Halotydeus destructor]|nr:hypothetical protein HDE_11004 [Halotydeus destructor]
MPGHSKSLPQLLDTIKQCLTCTICRGVMLHPVSLKCSHAYCLSCIRLWSVRSSQCPLCRQPFSLDEVSPCGPLEAIVDTFYDTANGEAEQLDEQTLASRRYQCEAHSAMYRRHFEFHLAHCRHPACIFNWHPLNLPSSSLHWRSSSMCSQRSDQSQREDDAAKMADQDLR